MSPWPRRCRAHRSRGSSAVTSTPSRCGQSEPSRRSSTFDSSSCRDGGAAISIECCTRHSALHEAVARSFRDELPDWTIAPEVSFAIWGERGVIDVLAWHPGRRALLVTELKTDIADANELVGTVDRKRRLAAQIARDRDWDPETVSVWVIVSSSRTNRRRLAAHAAMLHAAFPAGGRSIQAWLGNPRGSIAALSTWSESSDDHGGLAPVRRVRRVAHRSAA